MRSLLFYETLLECFVGIISTYATLLYSFHLPAKSHFRPVVHLQRTDKNTIPEIRVIGEMTVINAR